MLFTPIYIAMTFIKTWRIRSFRARLLEFLSGNTSVAFCKVPENAAETPTLSSKLCTNPKNAYLCDLLDYTNASRICSMKPTQCIEVNDWVSCAGGLPLGFGESLCEADLNVEVLFECEMEPHEESSYHDIVTLESMGQPIAWKAGSHLAIVLKTNIENLSVVGFHFVGGEFIIDHKLPVVRIQTVQISGEPNKATDLSMRGLRSEIQHSLKQSHEGFQWPIHAALLRKLSKVVDIKSDRRNGVEMNGGSDQVLETTSVGRRNVTLTDVSTITTKSLSADEDEPEVSKPVEVEVILPKESPVKSPLRVTETITESIIHRSPEKKTRKSPEKFLNKSPERKLVVPEGGELVVENVTVEIQHNITPKKSSLKLDLKKGTSQLSSSLLNISSQIKSITTHKRVVSTTAPKRPQSQMEMTTQVKEETPKSSPSQMTPKSTKSSRPLVNTKSPNVLIYSDSIVARDNLEASLKKVLDCDRYTVYSVTREALCAGAWRGRAALVAVAGCAGRAAPLLLAHLLDGGRLLALCSDLLHTVLPHYKTAEIRENEVVQFSYDKWKSVKMKHHIFCYQASPAKKQFSTESDRQPSKYTGHPGHELDIQVLASEETWRTPSLLQATDLTNNGVAIFSQIHLEADPCDYLREEGVRSNEARLEILHKILGDILGLHVKDTKELTQLEYTRGYFLGNHVQKMSLVEGWCKAVEGKRVQKLPSLNIQWCARNEPAVDPPSESFLPVYMYECPEHFSTVEYFDNLTSTHLGRVVIYADVVSSTVAVTSGALAHGVGAVARRQAAARGRGGNHWITPPGQAAMSLQVWRKISPTLPLAQHAAALAAVRAVRSDPAYDQLDIRIKWPNDIYFGRDTKIGGTITTANCLGDDVIVDIGTGVNISNSVPTTCINDIIADHNKKHGTSLAAISIEKFLARYCSQLERILEYMESDGGVDAFLEQYYQYWLHSDEEIRVQSSDGGSPVLGTISGLDPAGWLLVRTESGDIRVAPDGNTFDIMSGLIAPKL
ncbi:biotin--protein ligase isoform X2 [Bicyclus anynana]|uniref:Biotin--protein ligase isoform X2 n=1 Tax=Bicyclus anynana TaxID=110368 RepID=A0A6J1N587_BICAN|nr:biotin--protein ligase isoform X2 [Bicyclus anynana]